MPKASPTLLAFCHLAFAICHLAFGINTDSDVIERLWSPWRLAYITGEKNEHGCVFCAALSSADGDELIVFRGTTCLVILNLFPCNNGHLMLIPNRHLAPVGRLNDPER